MKAPIFKTKSSQPVEQDTAAILHDAEVNTTPVLDDAEVDNVPMELSKASQDDDTQKVPTRRGKARQARTDAERELLEKAAEYGNYVKLSDILPPVPSKGDFDVKTIKKSLYFFS